MAKTKGCARHGRKRKCMCKKGKRLVFAKPSRCGKSGKAKRARKAGYSNFVWSPTGKLCFGVKRNGKKRVVSGKKCARHFARTSHGLTRRGAKTWPPSVD